MINDQTTTSPGVQFLFVAACFVIVVAGMRAASPILVPFLLAVFIALISAPPLFWLREKGCANWLAFLIVIAAVVVLGLGIAAVVGNSVENFSAALPRYQKGMEDNVTGLKQSLTGLGVALPEIVFQDALDPQIVAKLTGRALSGLSAMIANTFFVLLMAIFILLEASGFPLKLSRMVRTPTDSLPRITKLADNIKRYIFLKTIVSVATGAFVAAWLAIIGVDHFVVWGLIAFLLNYVPNIGSIIAAIPAVFLAFVQGGLDLALGAAIAYMAVNILVGNVIEPKIMGRGLGLSALVVLLSLVFWGWVLGPVGMLLSIPLTMMIKIMLEGDEQTHWVSILLGPDIEDQTIEKE